jgi:hypothetical protein
LPGTANQIVAQDNWKVDSGEDLLCKQIVNLNRKGEPLSKSKGLSKGPIKIPSFEDLFPDSQDLINKWNLDLAKIKTDIENAVNDLTKLSVEIVINEKANFQKKIDMDLISGDVTVTLSKMPQKEEMEKIQTEALKLAQDNLDKRVDFLLKVINVLCCAISPTGPLTTVIKTLTETVKPTPT